jgi:hypothetical protein
MSIGDYVRMEKRNEQHRVVSNLTTEALEQAENERICDYERADGSNADLCLRIRDDDPCWRCAAVMELQRRRRVERFKQAMTETRPLRQAARREARRHG